MTLNFINLILGYLVFNFIFNNFEKKQLDLVVKISFILFVFVLIFYSVDKIKIFNSIFLENENHSLFDLIYISPLYEYLWNLFFGLKELRLFSSNSIFWTFSFLFLMVFEESNTKKNIILFFLIYLIIFYFY